MYGAVRLQFCYVKYRRGYLAVQYVYNIYAILHSFYHKRTFSNFCRNSPKKD